MSHQSAVIELRRQRGIQFDPELVDVFLSLFGTSSTATLRKAAQARK
jgi:HD-GYP domain-containing protein (c-di-GMP phosphodiesterase class II)